MSDPVFAAAAVLASLVLMYFFCVRRMRRGRGAMTPQAQAGGQASAATDREAEIARLRDEIAALKASNQTRKSR